MNRKILVATVVVAFATGILIYNSEAMREADRGWLPLSKYWQKYLVNSEISTYNLFPLLVLNVPELPFRLFFV